MIDLTAITENSEKTVCEIWIGDDPSKLYHLKTGSVTFHNRSDQDVTTVRSYFKDEKIVDDEGDPCIAFSIEVVGLKYVSTYSSHVEFRGFLKSTPDLDNSGFHVPQDGSLPTESRYLPPENRRIYSQLRGCRVKINIGPS